MNFILNLSTITVLLIQLSFLYSAKDNIKFKWSITQVTHPYSTISHKEMENMPTKFWMDDLYEITKLINEGKIMNTYFTFTLTAKICSCMLSCEYYLIWSAIDLPVAHLFDALPEDQQFQELRMKPVPELFAYKMLDFNEAFKKSDEIVIRASLYREKEKIFKDEQAAAEFIKNNSQHSRMFKPENTVISEYKLQDKIAKLDYSLEFKCKKESENVVENPVIVQQEYKSFHERKAEEQNLRVSYFVGQPNAFPKD